MDPTLSIFFINLYIDISGWIHLQGHKNIFIRTIIHIYFIGLYPIPISSSSLRPHLLPIFRLSMYGWHIPSIPLETGRGISTEACGWDDVLPLDDLGFGPHTQFYYYILTVYHTCVLSDWNKLFLRSIYKATLMCSCRCVGRYDSVIFLPGYKCIF